MHDNVINSSKYNLTMIILILILIASPNLYAEQLKHNQTVDALTELIKSKGVVTFEGALNLLSEEFYSPNNYKILYQSGSPQGASELEPRVILFGQGDELRIGFNHRRSQKKSLEIIQWRDKQKVWELSEIEFSNGKAHFSKVNPGQSVGCHDNNKTATISPNIDRNNFLVDLNIFSKKNTNNFLKVKDQDPVYKKLKFLSL